MTRRRTSKRKTSRRTKPVRRAAAVRRTSRRVRANTIPPPPRGNYSDLVKWALKTYQKGTRVRLRATLQMWSPSEDRDVRVPAGTAGKVVEVDPQSGLFTIIGHISIPLFTSSTTTQWIKNSTPEYIDLHFEPLDDNWGPLVIAPKRHSPPPTRGWQKQLSASRSMRARKVQPNATCPSCGSPHYFEGLFNRDCATPTCRYHRGGAIGSTGAGEPASSLPKLTGSRRLRVSSETVHASEPDVYPEIDHEMEEDIVIEADDLDDDETFAERAAKVIAEELGYVEGSDGSRPSRWYTQSDGEQDYGTGAVTRRSIHVDDDDWTAEEQREIYDILKRRRLVS